jgi:DNA (cytosine-5)-methyltransferase 1
MVSILGDYSYTFPKPIPLKLKLKDMLEDNVNKKYNLSDKMIDFFTYNEKKQQEKGNGFKFNVSDGNVIAKTITTRAGSRMDDNFIRNKSLQETLKKNNIDDACYIDTYNKRVDKEKSGTITTEVSFRNNTFLADSDLRIRKLTPKECFRLMGVKDEDYEKVAKNQSDSSLYHLEGDSIVANVLMAIFKELL